MGISSKHGRDLGFFDVAFPAGFSVMYTSDRIANGESVLPAVLKGTTQALFEDFQSGFLSSPVQHLLMGMQMTKAAGSLAFAINGASTERSDSILTSGAGMYNRTTINSKNAQTMRQRGMTMINEHGDVVRSAFGSEARTYYRNAFG